MRSKQPAKPERQRHRPGSERSLAAGGDGSEQNRSGLRRRALDLLARREHSRLELARKLGARGVADEEAIDSVLDELEREGLLATERFAETFVRARAARGQGPIRIRMELKERGVPDGDAYLGDGTYDWHALARETRAKRFGEVPPADFKERARQARYLEYRGFSRDQIASALEFDRDSD